jgi:hypothetical protein
MTGRLVKYQGSVWRLDADHDRPDRLLVVRLGSKVEATKQLNQEPPRVVCTCSNLRPSSTTSSFTRRSGTGRTSEEVIRRKLSDRPRHPGQPLSVRSDFWDEYQRFEEAHFRCSPPGFRRGCA